ncbi:MAG: hypothetical protein KDD92_03230 [Caldilineaceae bacterium]|nr:hypothetical protein [Caldilineaceae bacterium]
MDRTTPTAQNEEIELYIRTYYSLLRSSAPVRVRSLEDTHMAMKSSLHYHADSPELDITALVYAALRLPDCIHDTQLMIMGQMEDVFLREGYGDVTTWQPVRARARRRKFYYEPEQSYLAAFVSSVSDIDDLIPCLTAYQIEWNKLHQKLNSADIGRRLALSRTNNGYIPLEMLDEIRTVLGLSADDFARLNQLWPREMFLHNLSAAAVKQLDIRITVLGSGLSDYRRSVQQWWRRIEEVTQDKGIGLAQRPIYFVSSNIHSMVNLLSGSAWELEEELRRFVEEENPEDLRDELLQLSADDTGAFGNLLYYVLRPYINHANSLPEDHERVLRRERKAGVTRITEPHCLDVEAQIIEINRLRAKRVDPRLSRLSDEEWALLRKSDALIINIDYPLGMAAYHIFSQLSTAVGAIHGVYILGKAATLNGRVGDVMIPNVIYDEHSLNSYLFRNCFTAQDVAPYLKYGTVFDNQKAVTVRGTMLQNRDFMHVFYEEGYTDIEMEAGPYLSSLYEDIYPKRYPVNEIVNLFINAPYDIGLIHYASDTPISKRQSLLSKSLSYFGVDATYATSVAILNRILKNEAERLRTIVTEEKGTVEA